MTRTRSFRALALGAVILSGVLAAMALEHAGADPAAQRAQAPPHPSSAEGPSSWVQHDEARGPRHRIGRPIGEDELDDALELLEQVKPELAARLTSMRHDQPREVAQLIHRQFPHLRHLLRLKEVDPPMYELRVADVRLSYQSRDLAQKYQEAQAKADGEIAGALRDELSVLLEEHFELRQQIRKRELELLERRIAALREQIDARADDRQELIGHRLDELLGDAEPAEW